jgi:hypothetical protein
MAADSRPDEVKEFLSIYLTLTVALGRGIHSDSNRNEYQKQEKKFLGSRARPVRKVDNLTTICQPMA